MIHFLMYIPVLSVAYHPHRWVTSTWCFLNWLVLLGVCGLVHWWAGDEDDENNSQSKLDWSDGMRLQPVHLLS